MNLLQKTVWAATVVSCCFTFSAVTTADTLTSKKKKNSDTSTLSSELEVETSYGAGSRTRSGTGQGGNLSEQVSSFEYVLSPRLNEGVLLRLGAGWERFSFGLPANISLPNTLQSANLILGADIELSDEWLLRLETTPGLYSDFKDINANDFNAPFITGFSWLVDKNLQWFFGMSVNTWRDIPVIPGCGVRWKFADRWTLMALMPKPRLEYELTEKLTLHAGSEIKGGTYRVNRQFGDTHGRPTLNNAKLDLTEIRMGVGASWKILPTVNVNIEGGCMVYREFEFTDKHVSFYNSPAPYGQISFEANF